MSSDDDAGKMPPPALPAPKPQKKTRTKNRKVSTSSTDSSSSVPAVPKGRQRGRTKKKHAPIPIKVEKIDEAESEGTASEPAPKAPIPAPRSKPKPTVAETVNVLDATFDVPGNTTFNIAAPAQSTMVISDQTVVIEPKDPRSSIMTEDNDEDLPIAAFKPPPVLPKPVVAAKKPGLLGSGKKNGVFKPYLQSPLKKKIEVEAFEKHATLLTPEKGKAKEITKAKSIPTKHTTPSSTRLAMLQATKTTPLVGTASAEINQTNSRLVLFFK